MAEGTLWDSQQFTNPGFAEAGTKDLASTPIQSLSLSEIDHDSVIATLEIESISPDDADGVVAPSYNVALSVETRAAGQKLWNRIGYTKSKITTAAQAPQRIIEVGPGLQAFGEEELIQVAADQVGKKTRHQGFLQQEFRFCLVLSENDPGGEGEFVSVTVSLDYSTYQAR